MNVIQDVPVADYIKKAGVEKQMSVRHLGEGVQIGALALEKAWLHTGLWAPISAHATTMEDFFRVYSADKHAAIYKPETLAALKKRTANGVTPANDRLAFALGSDANYWHYVKDFITRLCIYFEMDLRGAPLLVGPSFGEAQHAILKQIFEWAGRPLPPVMRLGDEYAALGPTLFPSLVSIPAAAMIWAGPLKPPLLTDKKDQRLFIMREGVARRQMRNQDEVAKRLQEEGFLCLDPGGLSFNEQVALFQGASLIVGVHGAALTNLLFAPAQGGFIELTPDARQPFYRDLAVAKKWKVAQLGERLGEGLPRDQHRDFHIDLAFIEAALRPLL